MKRRKFLRASLAATPLAFGTALPLAVFPERNNKGFKVNAGEGRFHGHIQLQGLNKNFLDLKVSGKDTNGDLAIFQSTTLTPKSGPPLHVHFDQDEIFYVLEGEYLFQVGEEKYHLKPGDTVFLPRKVPHTWAQLQETGKLMVILQPAGKMEEFFLSAASPATKDFTPEQRAKNMEKYDMKAVGPPLKVE
jgi:quercetin dioxygenase-like cupin family protein